MDIVAVDASLTASAQALARRLRASGCELPGGLCLVLDSAGLSLQLASGARVNVDFVGGRMGYRRSRDIGKRQPLARAVGITRGLLDVVDATAGLGRDAFVLAALGARMRLLERSPVVAALLADGLARAAATAATTEIVGRMELQQADACDFLARLQPAQRPEVVYLDPMYPDHGKGAQVKKEMQALRELLGPPQDGERLLCSALHAARRRVVVKRPRGAEGLPGARPDHCVESPNTRYDVYVCRV